MQMDTETNLGESKSREGSLCGDFDHACTTDCQTGWKERKKNSQGLFRCQTKKTCDLTRTHAGPIFLPIIADGN